MKKAKEVEIPEGDGINLSSEGNRARLWFEGGVLCIEGNLSSAARTFFTTHLQPLIDDYVENRLKG